MGWKPDPHGVTATGVMSASSIEDWRRAIRRMAQAPVSKPELVAISIVLDTRAIYGTADNVRSLMRNALLPDAASPAVAIGARHQAPNRLHERHVSGIRVSTRASSTSSTAGCCRSSTSPATRRRPLRRRRSRPRALAGCRGGRDATTTDAATLGEAFELFSELRLEHRVRQLAAIEARTLNREERNSSTRSMRPPLPAGRVPSRRVGPEGAGHEAVMGDVNATPWRQAGLC